MRSCAWQAITINKLRGVRRTKPACLNSKVVTNEVTEACLCDFPSLDARIHHVRSRAEFRREAGPLEGLRFVVEWLGRIALRVIAAIEDADCVGLQFDNELLDHVIDRLLADRNFDRAIVLASGEFALDEDQRAFDEAFGEGLKTLPVGNDVVPLRSVLHSPLSSFQDFLVATENLTTAMPLARYLASAFLPTNPTMVS